MTVKQLDQFALDWIKLRSLTLAKSINKTTLEALRIQLALGFEAGESIQQLTKRIEGYFSEHAKYRAERVARSETIAASNEGALHRFETEGVGKSEFYPSPDACEICLPLAGEYVTRDAHNKIPVHPNCRCVWLPVIDSMTPFEPAFTPESIAPTKYDVPYDKATPKEEVATESWFNQLPVEQKESVNEWMEHGFKEIRSSQISGNITPEIQAKIASLDRALESAPAYNKSIYRGIKNLAPDDIIKLANSDEITLNAITSFSGSKHTAFGFTHGYDYGVGAPTAPIKSVLFEVRGKEGIGKLIQSTEREVLVKSEKSFSVIKREVIQYEKDRARVLHIVMEAK